ncbi:MAG: hypothetical protein KJT03_20405, partial [Verrucomicrobiae bacterium]|nr:hypothetical protein [Verrucomicrobiae bacterium]
MPVPKLNPLAMDTTPQQNPWPRRMAFLLCGLIVLALPWLLGGQILEVQIATLCMVATGFALSVVTRGNSLKVPLVLFLVLLIYLLIQWLNPAYKQQWQLGLRIWNLVPLDHLGWLPSSIDSDFTDSSPLRFLILFGAAILLALALYRISSRTVRRWLIPGIAINAAVIALVGLIQVSLDSKTILGWYHARDEGLGLFFATLLYKNHAAAFFNLGLAASLSSFYYFGRAYAHRRSNPRWLFLICALVLLCGVIF